MKFQLYLLVFLIFCNFFSYIIVYVIKINASMQLLLGLEVFEIMAMELDYDQWILNSESVNLRLLI